MIVEIFVLALASSIRPTSLAAVYTLLTPESRRRLMLTYVVTGLTFTVAFGLVIVYASHAVQFHSGSDRTKAVAEIVGGVAAVAPGRSSGWGRRLTMKTAALAGPLTHIPGLFYLIALNVIVAHDPGVPRGMLSVAIYNVIWFALPIFALAVCIVRPHDAQRAVGAVEGWAREHARAILLVASFGVGIALIVRGALTA